MIGKNRTIARWPLWVAAFSMFPLGASAQRVIDFGDLSLAPESYYNGSDEAGGFSSAGLHFNNAYNTEWESWGGWAYSNVSDTETGTFENQYAAITGSGLGASGIYGVAYVDTFTPAIPRIELPEGEHPLGVQVTNTTYAYQTMLEGDEFAKQFGGSTGDDPDYFRLTVSGLDAGEAVLDSVDFYLADYRFEDNDLNYIVDSWSSVDLSTFPEETRFLEFTLDSSDSGALGMNTPAYFALGEVTVVPEPGTYALLAGLGAGALLVFRKRRRNTAGQSIERRR